MHVGNQRLVLLGHPLAELGREQLQPALQLRQHRPASLRVDDALGKGERRVVAAGGGRGRSGGVRAGE